MEQLFEYGYFDVPDQRKPPGGRMQRALVYSQRPPSEMIPYLNSISLLVFWVEAGELAGVEGSLAVLQDFAAKAGE